MIHVTDGLVNRCSEVMLGYATALATHVGWTDQRVLSVNHMINWRRDVPDWAANLSALPLGVSPDVALLYYPADQLLAARHVGERANLGVTDVDADRLQAWQAKTLNGAVTALIVPDEGAAARVAASGSTLVTHVVPWAAVPAISLPATKPRFYAVGALEPDLLQVARAYVAAFPEGVAELALVPIGLTADGRKALSAVFGKRRDWALPEQVTLRSVQMIHRWGTHYVDARRSFAADYDLMVAKLHGNVTITNALCSQALEANFVYPAEAVAAQTRAALPSRRIMAERPRQPTYAFDDLVQTIQRSFDYTRTVDESVAALRNRHDPAYTAHTLAGVLRNYT